MDCSTNAPQKQADVRSKWVWFAGSTALAEGQGLCYDAFDVTAPIAAATVADARRYNRVIVPVVANAKHFAGVAARDYAARPNGQMIEIFCPGSVCNVLLNVGVSTVVGTTALGCSYDAGMSVVGSFKASAVTGKAGAIALQTITGDAVVHKCLAVLQEGVQSGVVA